MSKNKDWADREFEGVEYSAVLFHSKSFTRHGDYQRYNASIKFGNNNLPMLSVGSPKELGKMLREYDGRHNHWAIQNLPNSELSLIGGRNVRKGNRVGDVMRPLTNRELEEVASEFVLYRHAQSSS